MRLKIIYQINERYIMEKIEINFYKNKMKDIKMLKNYTDAILI